MRAALLPLAGAFGALCSVRRAVYRRGWLPVGRAGVPVVSVGGLSVGGSGKTPVAEYLARRLLSRGIRVGLVAGGYRGRARSRVLQLTPTSAWARGSAEWYGDEAVLLARRVPQSIVVRGPDKLAAARLAAQAGAHVVVVDDGFQHLRLSRSLDIVTCGPGDGPPLPAGRGRELAAARRHADLLWWHQRGGAERAEPRAASDCAVVSSYEPEALVDLAGVDVGPPGLLRGRRVFLLAGIALPEAFATTVARQQAEVVGRCFVRDHGFLGRRHLARAAAAGADWVLCSEKDLVRWERLLGARRGPAVVALRCRLRVGRGSKEIERCLDQLVAARA